MLGIKSLVVAGIPCLIGCSSGETPGLIESAPTWVVASEPTTRIGGEESDQDPLYQVAGAARIDSGYLVVNRSADELRLYDVEGHTKNVLGRDGSGPGEFRYPQIIGRLKNDSVVVYDSRNDRVSIVCSGTEICSEIPMKGLGRVVGVGGEYVVVVLRNVSGGLMTEPGVHRRPYELGVFNRATSGVDTLTVIDGQPIQVGGQDRTVFAMAVPLTKPPQVSAGQDVVFLANGQDPELEIWMLSGRRVGSIALPIELQPVTDAEFKSTVQEMMSPELDEAGLSRTLEAMEHPAYRAPIRRLLVDRTNLVWVELNQDQSEMHQWLVTDTTGNMRARASTPVGVNVLEIGEDYVLGVWKDTLGVEYLQVHQLERRR